jgi:hypothetical protein
LVATKTKHAANHKPCRRRRSPRFLFIKVSKHTQCSSVLEEAFIEATFVLVLDSRKRLSAVDLTTRRSTRIHWTSRRFENEDDDEYEDD